MLLGQVKSELLKVRSTQVWIWMLVVSVLITGLNSAGTVYLETNSDLSGDSLVDYYSIFTQSREARLALIVLGLLGLTTEFRHKTITPTLLAVANRWHLMAAKALSYGLLAMVYSAVCVGVNFAIAIIWLNAKNVPVHMGGDVPLGVLKAYVSLVLMGLFGLGLGGVIRNQAASMVAGLVYYLAIDGIWLIIPQVRKVWPWTPGGSIRAFLSQHGLDGLPSDVTTLSPTSGLLVFLAWIALLLLAATQLLVRRDVS
jgi:hypothetical protein